MDQQKQNKKHDKLNKETVHTHEMVKAAVIHTQKNNLTCKGKI